MRYINLTDLDKENLEQAYKNHPKFHVRQRSQALLLNGEGTQVKDIAKIFNVRTRTIYTWLDRWESMGIIGIFIMPGRGIKPHLSIKDTKVVQEVKKKL